MIEHKTPETIVAEIKMVRTKFEGTILVTEGDSDYKFLNFFIATRQCYLLSAHGKENAVKCIPLAHKESIKGVLSFIDSDFDRILKKLPKNRDIIATDFHDCEMLMIMTEAFDTVVAEYGSSKKINIFLNNCKKKDLRAVLFGICIPIGILRLLSIKKKYNLKFKNIDFGKFIGIREINIDIKKFVECVLANSKGHSLELKKIITDIKKEEVGNSYKAEQICNGHDFAEVLAIGLRRAIGSCDSKIGNRDNVEKLLRIAYSFEKFKKTNCYNDMLCWEKRNRGFQIFPVE